MKPPEAHCAAGVLSTCVNDENEHDNDNAVARLAVCSGGHTAGVGLCRTPPRSRQGNASTGHFWVAPSRRSDVNAKWARLAVYSEVTRPASGYAEHRRGATGNTGTGPDSGTESPGSSGSLARGYSRGYTLRSAHGGIHVDTRSAARTAGTAHARGFSRRNTLRGRPQRWLKREVGK